MLDHNVSKKTLTKLRDDIAITTDFRSFKKNENQIDKLMETKSKSLKEVKDKRHEELPKLYKKIEKVPLSDTEIHSNSLKFTEIHSIH